MSERNIQQELDTQSFSNREASVNAVSRPSRATFARIAQDPKATTKRAYTWVLGSIAIEFGFTLGSVGFNIEGLTAGAILALLTFLLFVLDTATSHWLAKAFGGAGTYSRLANAVAAYYAPFIVLSALLDLVPYLFYLNVLLILYGACLKVLAVAGTYQFNWKKAVGSAFALQLGLGLLFLLFLLGTSFGATVFHFWAMSEDDPGPYIITDAIFIGMLICGLPVAIIGAAIILNRLRKRAQLYDRNRGSHPDNLQK